MLEPIRVGVTLQLLEVFNLSVRRAVLLHVPRDDVVAKLLQSLAKLATFIGRLRIMYRLPSVNGCVHDLFLVNGEVPIPLPNLKRVPGRHRIAHGVSQAILVFAFLGGRCLDFLYPLRNFFLEKCIEGADEGLLLRL